MIRSQLPASTGYGRPASAPVSEALDSVRLALRRLKRLARGVRDVWSEHQRAGFLAQIASIHESVALPRGKFGRVAADLASNPAAGISDDIDLSLEALFAVPARSTEEWKRTVAGLILKLEGLAESEELRLSAANCMPPRSRLAETAWSPNLFRLLESGFFELKRTSGNSGHYPSLR